MKNFIIRIEVEEDKLRGWANDGESTVKELIESQGDFAESCGVEVIEIIEDPMVNYICIYLKRECINDVSLTTVQQVQIDGVVVCSFDYVKGYINLSPIKDFKNRKVQIYINDEFSKYATLKNLSKDNSIRKGGYALNFDSII